MTIELIGLPGCGKSTLIKLFKENYVKDRFEVLDRSYFPKAIKRLWNKPLRTICYAVYYFFLHGERKLKILLLRFLWEYKINRYSLLYTVYAMYYMYFIKKHRNKLVFVDEGIIQFLSSIPHDKIIKESKVIKALCEEIRTRVVENIFIFCELPIRMVVERIQIRNRKDRFSIGENLEGLLSIKNTNLKFLTENIGCIVNHIDMQSIDESQMDMLSTLIKQHNEAN